MNHIARIINANEFASFVLSIPEEGICKISGKLNKTGGVVAHAYEFDANKFTAESAKDWLTSKKITVVEFAEAYVPEEIKAGARHSSSDMGTINKIHGMARDIMGHCASLGADGATKSQEEIDEELKSFEEDLKGSI